MRTTMQTIHQNILGNLNRLTDSLNQINNRISSGKEMSKISDNPVNLVGALGLRSSLAEIRQYKTNLLYGNNFIKASESSLTQVKELLIRAKVLTLQAVNASMTPDNRASMAEEVRNLFEQAVILANTEENGKYIFAGHRTTGYTAAEPTPFMADRLDGYQINGQAPDYLEGQLTTIVDNTAVAAGDLAVNGTATGAINAGAVTSGLNMEKAFNAKTAIEAADPAVAASLTTLYSSGVAATGDAGGDGLPTTISFELNGIPMALAVPDSTGAAGTAAVIASVVNMFSEQTGVSATVGDGTNGGGLNEVVFRNTRPGDESAITVANYAVAGEADAGFGDFSQAAGIANNTGQISLSSAASFELSSPNNPADDTILAALGLGGGGIGFGDEAADGTLVYGPRLGNGDLEINGTAILAPMDDGLSDVYADLSAAAKAAAVNGQTAETGVSATITPAYHQAMGAVEAGILATGDLLINGVDIFSPGSGNLTTLYTGNPATAATADSEITFQVNGLEARVNYANGDSAAAIAQAAVLAINDLSDNTGVSAFVGDGSNGGAVNEIVFRNVQAGNDSNIVVNNFTVVSGNNNLGFGNFNGGTPVGIIGAEDGDNALINAINAMQAQTGIAASRSSVGGLLLSATDGRNLHIQSSERGERITRLNSSGSPAAQDRVYFGEVQLRSERVFSLETTPTAGAFETGLEAFGMAGGGFEPDDVAGDGVIQVQTIHTREGSVRYTGERSNDIEIKVSKSNTLAVSKNGADALMTTGVFSTLKDLENFLRGQKFTAVNSLQTATDLTATFASGNTGIPDAEEMTTGSLTVTVTDQDQFPPRDFTLTIPVDPAVDTPEGLAQKINGVPGMQASWDSDGHLQLSTLDAGRYTFTVGDDSSGFLEAMAISMDTMQVQALEGSLGQIDVAMDELTSQVSDFGARSNRIDIQNQILINLELSATENLSEKEDTDIIKALMELKNKETAYQAALSAAAKTMQLSLVNYL